MIKKIVLTLALSAGIAGQSMAGEPFSPYENLKLNDDRGWAIACMAMAIYHEARSERELAQLGVGYVVLNRVKSPMWPNSVCEVVYQQHQWSWTSDQRTDLVFERSAFEKAKALAKIVLDGLFPDPTYGADHVLTRSLYLSRKRPRWANTMRPTLAFDRLVFLKSNPTANVASR